MSHLKTTVRAIGTPLNLVFCGLDYAGKTAMYIRLKTGKFVADLKPTLSSTMDSISLTDDDDIIQARIFDLGGQKALRDLWKSYIENAHAIIYVVDANDPSRFKESKKEFQDRIVPLTTKTPCIIVCNKFDLVINNIEGSKPSEIINKLESKIEVALNVPKNDKFAILVASQKTGYGLPKVTRLIREFVRN